MESKNFQTKKPIIRGNLSDPQEKARILRRYAGIFPNNIVEFGNRVIKKYAAQKNYSK